MLIIALFIGFLMKAAVLLLLMALGAGMLFWGAVAGLAFRFAPMLLILIACGIALFLYAGSSLAALLMPAVLA